MTAQDDALFKALNDAMLDFNRACTREDAEGDPRDWVHAAYLHAWKAGRAYEASRATADRAELEALRQCATDRLVEISGDCTTYEDAFRKLEIACAALTFIEGQARLLAAAPTAERRPADGDGGA